MPELFAFVGFSANDHALGVSVLPLLHQLTESPLAEQSKKRQSSGEAASISAPHA
jgi:hypothetical protein